MTKIDAVGELMSISDQVKKILEECRDPKLRPLVENMGRLIVQGKFSVKEAYRLVA